MTPFLTLAFSSSSEMHATLELLKNKVTNINECLFGITKENGLNIYDNATGSNLSIPSKTSKDIESLDLNVLDISDSHKNDNILIIQNISSISKINPPKETRAYSWGASILETDHYKSVSTWSTESITNVKKAHNNQWAVTQSNVTKDYLGKPNCFYSFQGKQIGELIYIYSKSSDFSHSNSITIPRHLPTPTSNPSCNNHLALVSSTENSLSSSSKNLSAGKNEKDKQLTVGSNNIDDKFTDSPQQMTFNDVLNLYINAKRLSPRTKKLYIQAVNKVFSHDANTLLSEINWMQKKKDIFLFDEEKSNIKRSTFTLYVNCLKALTKWAYNRDFISKNYLANYCVENSPNAPKSHRNALECENFSSNTEAIQKHRTFLRALIRYLNKKGKEEHITLWLIHAVLCTRRSETIRVIKQFKKGNKSVIIKTKCYENFRIPIIPEVAELILKIKPWICSLEDRTAEEYILRCIPPKFRPIMCAHGTRAIYRTVIEFLDLKGNISDSLKEAYIAHFPGSSTIHAYMRNFLLNKRKYIQEVWAAWLCKSLPIPLKHLLLLQKPKFKGKTDKADKKSTPKTKFKA